MIIILDNGRISSVEFLLLLIIIDGATAFLYGPSESARLAGPDSWLSVSVIPSAYALLVAAVCITLARRFPHKVFNQYLPEVLGKVPGKVLSAAYAINFIFTASVILSEGSTFIHTAFLRETPPLVLDFILVGVAVYGAYLGIEVIARQNGLVLPFWLFSIFLVVILVAKEINPENLKPFLENGIIPVLKGSLPLVSFRGEIFLILMLFPYLNHKDEALKLSVLFLFLIAFLTALMVGTTVGVFGSQVVSHLVFPFYELARYISVAQFLERFEAFIVIMWVAGVISKLAIFFHSSAVAAASTLGLKNYRTTLFPLAVASIIIGKLLYGSSLKLTRFLFKTTPYHGAGVELLIPAMVLIIAIIRKKGRAERYGLN